MDYILTVGRNERRFNSKEEMKSIAKTLKAMMPTVEFTESQRGPTWHTDKAYLDRKNERRKKRNASRS